MSSHSRAATRQREQHRINDRIRAREVRLIGPDGDQLGIKPVPEALRLARGLELDLVEVAPMANPPVCRIMDYGKFRYEEAQKAKESRRKSTNVSVKEVKFRPKIGRGDFDVKVRKVDQFIHEGPQGQGDAAVPGPRDGPPGARHQDPRPGPRRGRPVVKVETQARLEGRNMSMVLSPDKKALDAAKADRRGRRDPRARRQPTSSRTHEPAPAAEPSSLNPPAPEEHHTMPKMKTSKTAAKRFKTTGTGRVRRQQAMRQHLFEKKPSTRTRRLAADADVHPTDLKKIKRLLGER